MGGRVHELCLLSSLGYRTTNRFEQQQLSHNTKLTKAGQTESTTMIGFSWFECRAIYDRALDQIDDTQTCIEQFISALDVFRGYCNVCESIADLKVNVGIYLAGNPHLREGMVCERCGMSARQRLAYSGIMERMGQGAVGKRVFVLERLTGFYEVLSRKLTAIGVREIHGAEFLGSDLSPGATVKRDGLSVHHEDLTNLSLASASVEYLLHFDVLEHVSDYEKALTESFRVLEKGGEMLFTVPFFDTRDTSLIRARTRPDGSLEHLEEPEYHGDPLNRAGVLAFYHYGWDLLESCRRAGFSRVALGMNFDPFQGFLSTNSPVRYYKMQPVVMLCTK